MRELEQEILKLKEKGTGNFGTRKVADMLGEKTRIVEQTLDTLTERGLIKATIKGYIKTYYLGKVKIYRSLETKKPFINYLMKGETQ